jgi:hypothetical protein
LLRNWYVTNKDKIKLIYGAPQAKALDNFTSYASYMDAASRAGNKLPRSLDVLSVGARLGGAGAAKFIGVGAPLIIGSEGGAYVLAKGLSDPNSALFKLFTEGVSDKTRSLWLATGQMGGAAGGKAFADAE